MNPQLDASKLRSVAGRPPTPIPSDEENDDDDEQQQQQQNGAGNSSLLDATTEGRKHFVSTIDRAALVIVIYVVYRGDILAN